MGCPACKVVLCAREKRVISPSTAGELQENMLRDVCMTHPVSQTIGALKGVDDTQFNDILSILDAQPMNGTQRTTLSGYLDTLCAP